MGNLSFGHLLVLLLVVLLLFGAGRVADIGKGLGEGIRNFKKGLNDDEAAGKDIVVVKKKADPQDDDAPQLTAKKKKIIQVEVDDDADAEQIARELAKKTAAKDEKPA